MALGVLIIWETRTLKTGSFFRPGPGLFPLCLGILLVLFSVLCFFLSNPEKFPKLSWALIPRSVLYVIGILFVYRFSLPVLGFSLSTLFLFIILLKIVGGQRWLPTLGWSAAITSASYLLFVRVFEVPFPAGVIPF